HRNPIEYPRLFQGANDLEFIEDVYLDQVKELLFVARRTEDALHLLLLCLDSHRSSPVRVGAVKTLNDLLDSETIALHIRYVVYANPIHESADVNGALSLCDKNGATRTKRLIDDLVTDRHAIEIVRRAWDRIPKHLYGEPDADKRNEYQCKG